jgi:hypothetical protein
VQAAAVEPAPMREATAAVAAAAQAKLAAWHDDAVATREAERVLASHPADSCDDGSAGLARFEPDLRRKLASWLAEAAGARDAAPV